MKNILVTVSDSKERELIDYFIAKAFGSLARTIHAPGQDSAIKKAGIQKFHVVIADGDAEGFSPSKLVFELQALPKSKDSSFIFISNEGASCAPRLAKNKNVHNAVRPVNYFKLIDLLSKQLGLEGIEQYRVSKFSEDIARSANSFLSKVLFEPTDLQNPILKPEGESLKGKSGIIYSNKTHEKSTNFIFMYESSLLEKLSESIGQRNQFSTLIVGKAATKIIFSNLQSHFETLFKESLGSILIVPTNDTVLNDLKGKKGICISLKSAFGHLYLYVF